MDVFIGIFEKEFGPEFLFGISTGYGSGDVFLEVLYFVCFMVVVVSFIVDSGGWMEFVWLVKDVLIREFFIVRVAQSIDINYYLVWILVFVVG